MKYFYRHCLFATLFTATSAFAAEVIETKKPEVAPGSQPNQLLENMETLLSETNRISYAIGVNVARNLKANFPQLHLEFFLLGLKDIFDENRLKLSEDDINRSIARYNELSTSHVQKQVNDFKADSLQNAEKFLEQNGKKEGIVTLPSGMQYRVLSPGNGPMPKEDGMAIVEYHAKAINGQTVDSTLVGDNKGPASIMVKNALPFWREVLPKMPLGAKWELYVHPKLAYGATGSAKVPANTLLIYSAEIVGIQ